METNLSAKIKTGGKTPLEFIRKILKKIKAFFLFAARAASTPFKGLWKLLCLNRGFARFAYVDFPARRKKAAAYIKKHLVRFAAAFAVFIAAFATLLFVTLKNTENSDYRHIGGGEADFGMVLPHYCTFDHSEKPRISVKLSWEDGAADLENGKAEIKISARVYPVNLKNPEVKFMSSDEKIAVVDKNGNIRVKNPGKVKISALLVHYGKSASASLSARQPVTGIFMPESTITLYTNGTGRLLRANVLPANATDPSVIWKSKNTKVARVDSNGNVRPVGTGMTEITAVTADGAFEGRCFVTVVAPSVDVETLSLQNADDMHISVGDSVNAVITVSPQNARNKTLKWSSSDNDVAEVSQTGRVRGTGEGVAEITAESVNGKKCTFKVEVSAADGGDPFDLSAETETPPESGTVTYTPYDVTFPQAVRIQMMQNPQPKIWTSGGFKYASQTETAEYMNPNSYFDGAYKYQFLDLSYTNGVSEESLNDYLADKGALSGMAHVFIEAAREFGVSEVYLAAHACLESGNGTSELARGVETNGSTVYNVFGINAYDDDPVSSGASRAYEEGWTSVEAAIRGGAKWISEHYINNPDVRQNTLYKMRWDPEMPGEHQYATDISWAVKQAVSIEGIFSQFAEASVSFDVPVYSGQIPPTITPDI